MEESGVEALKAPKDASLKSRPKMEDIARRVGVHVSTVSRALAGSPLVQEETRKRIAEAVAEVGYVVNHGARGLRLQRTGQVLIMVPNIASAFFPEVVLGIEETLQAESCGVLIGNTSNDPEREDALARQLLNGAVDGMLLLTGRKPGVLQSVADADDRIVAISRPVPKTRIVCVGIDHGKAAQEATAYLIARGHRRVAHIAGPADSPVSQARLRGFRRALARAGLAAAPELEIHAAFSITAGQRAMEELLARRLGISAVLCSSDEVAMGAIKAARRAGRRVPDDISFVGFDDLEFAAVYEPALTTVHIPRRRLGNVAAETLLDLLAGHRPERKALLLPHQLIERDSVSAFAPPQAPR
jgi:DNA-binding LacI/PurR family transcriptional regulator